jgi:hypothetical protein
LKLLYMLTIVLSIPYLSFICWPSCCLSPVCPLYVDHCVVYPLLVPSRIKAIATYDLAGILLKEALTNCKKIIFEAEVWGANQKLCVLYMLTIVLSVPCLSFICWPLCCLSPACPSYVGHCIVSPLLVI